MKAHRYSVLTVRTATGEHKAFLDGGFYHGTETSNRIHEHNYTEIHLIAGGNASFIVDGKTVVAKSGTVLVLPKKTFHCCDKREENALQCAFQIDCEAESFSAYEINAEVIIEFFRATEKLGEEDDHSAIAAYVALFCSLFERGGKLSAQKITDYGFVIFEFFSQNYSRPVRLEDLAEALHLSERQAERLVFEHTGRSFRDELAATRVRMARQLLESTEMTQSEVAEYVGYRSYAGFWKAMKKY